MLNIFIDEQGTQVLRVFGRGPQTMEVWEPLTLGQWFSKWSISTPRGQLDHPRGR